MGSCVFYVVVTDGTWLGANQIAHFLINVAVPQSSMVTIVLHPLSVLDTAYPLSESPDVYDCYLRASSSR